MGTKNHVSIDYFTCAEACADYVVHECAHVFHNTKRRTVGLPFTRTKVWMLDPLERQVEVVTTGNRPGLSTCVGLGAPTLVLRPGPQSLARTALGFDVDDAAEDAGVLER